MIKSVEVVLGLLSLVAALTFLGRKLPVPLPILQVMAGLVLGLIPGMPRVHLSPEVVFLVFLPPLLYPAALFTSWRDFHANLRPILFLAVGLVLFTTVVVGFLAHGLIPGFSLASGFVLGAIVSPPDAVAATAIAQRLLVPHRIVTVLEGESLVNDATALVAYRFAAAAVVSGTVSWGRVSGEFLLVGFGGILIGLAVGYLTAHIQKAINDPPIEITLSLLTPFAAYLPAEELGFSGVLAVVTTGLYNGWHAPEYMTSRTRLQEGPVWRMIEFLLNGFIFLLIGLQLPEVLRSLSGQAPAQLAWYALVVSLAVVLVRIAWVFPATYIPRFLFKSIRLADPYPSWRHVALVGWTGMRGVVSLAAALALPVVTPSGSGFPGRELILFLTFVVIIVTLVLQGLTLPLLIRVLGVEGDRVSEQEETKARLQANKAALARIDELSLGADFSEELSQRLRSEYKERIQELERVDDSTSRASPGLFSADYERLSREALKVERATILNLRNQRVINDEVLRRVQRDIDLAEVRLRDGE
jgi:CPA1 family monovalent cation:H+ antiporter